MRVLTPHDPPQALIDLAVGQGGYLNHDQVTRMGLGRRQIERLCGGRWQRHARGLYYLGLQQPTFGALAWGGVLLGGDGAMVGGLAAARLWRMRVDEPPVIDIWLQHGRRRSDYPYRFRADTIGRHPKRVLARTSVEDTLLDVCGDPDMTIDAMSSLIGESVGSGLTTADRIRQKLTERRAQPRRPLLLEIIGDTATGSRSALERRYLVDVERAHGLPRGLRQVRGIGAVIDVLYEEFRLAVELDGAEFHGGSRRQRDRERDNAHAVGLGLFTLRYGWGEVATSPCMVAGQTAAALQVRGWQGTLRACRRCRRLH